VTSQHVDVLVLTLGFKKYKTQSETADFAPGAATWRTGRNIRIIFDSANLLHCVKRDTYKTGYS